MKWGGVRVGVGTHIELVSMEWVLGGTHGRTVRGTHGPPTEQEEREEGAESGTYFLPRTEKSWRTCRGTVKRCNPRNSSTRPVPAQKEGPETNRRGGEEARNPAPLPRTLWKSGTPPRVPHVRSWRGTGDGNWKRVASDASRAPVGRGGHTPSGVGHDLGGTETDG